MSETIVNTFEQDERGRFVVEMGATTADTIVRDELGNQLRTVTSFNIEVDAEELIPILTLKIINPVVKQAKVDLTKSRQLHLPFKPQITEEELSKLSTKPDLTEEEKVLWLNTLKKLNSPQDEKAVGVS